MVPAVFVLLDKFPLTVNGKLDRRALPLPVVEKHSGQREPQRGSIEHTLTTIWQEVLQVDYVGRQDSFLEIGGHHCSRLRCSLEYVSSCRSNST